MKVSREQMAANRERILQIASSLFRERGFEGVGVAEVMQLAGLTHGGFYGHFASKETLAAEAAAYALMQTTARWSKTFEEAGRQGLQGIVDLYLSPKHRDSPGAGCPIAALGTDVFRQSAPVKDAFSKELMRQIDMLASFMPGSPERKRKKALTLLTQLVGAIVLARAIDRKALSDEILAAARSALEVPDSDLQ
jgi:TetR/AcrR family transcriptional repressor of nem operon